MFKSDVKNGILLFILSGVMFFSLLGGHGLLEPDEGRYSEIPREMIESGDYVTPRLNGVLYFEKPVLHYWLTASAFSFFGQNEFASRFWPALLGVLGVLSTYVIGSKLYGKKSGLLAGTILSSSLLYYATAQINLTDMPLGAFVTLAMTGFVLALRGNRRWLILFYLAMGAAVLTKGLVGIVLPCGAIFMYIMWTRRWSIVTYSLYLPGIALFLAVTVPWFKAVCDANPDFFHFFFIQEHFLRYTTRLHHRYEPFWYFIPILILATVPWTGFLVPSRKKSMEENDQTALMICWFVFVFLFFSASSSKLVPYMVPALPPLAILISVRAISWNKKGNLRSLKIALAWTSTITVPLGTALIAYPFLQDDLPRDIMVGQLVHKGIILLLGTAAAWIFASRKNMEKTVICLAVTGVIWTGSFKTGFSLYDRINSARDLAMLIKPHIEEGDVMAQYGQYLQGITFYLERRNVLVDYEGELAFGASRERDPRWFIDLPQLTRLWNGDDRVFLIAKKESYDGTLKDRLEPIYVLGTDWEDDNVVISNRKTEEAQR